MVHVPDNVSHGVRLIGGGRGKRSVGWYMMYSGGTRAEVEENKRTE